jgi:small-conductance mechanosensitive channel/CRP-like cAMP-binding protein
MNSAVLLGVGLFTLLLLAAGRLLRWRLLKRLRWTLVLLAMASLVDWAVEMWRVGGPWEEWTSAAMLLALGLLAVRVLVMLVLEWFLERRAGVIIPRLAHDVVALLLYLLVAFLVLHYVLELKLSGIALTSAALTVVLGLALQETLGTLMAGLTLAWEKRLEQGVWVELDGVIGIVEELGWRSLILRDNLDQRLLVPNSTVARARLRVLGNGEEPVAIPTRLGVSYKVAPHLVKRLLREVAADIPAVVANPPPKVITVQYADSAIVYEVRVWTRQPSRHNELTDEVLTRSYTALARHGYEIPFPQRTLHLAPPKEAEDAELRAKEALASCQLFAGLPESALEVLAKTAHRHSFAPGEAVVREGEESRALYVVARGEAVVVRRREEIARIGQGEVFGEMAFLSGAPRSATVRAAGGLDVVEVDSHAMRALLQEHSELAEELAGRMVARQKELEAHEGVPTGARSRRGLAGFLLQRLQRLVAG